MSNYWKERAEICKAQAWWDAPNQQWIHVDKLDATDKKYQNAIRIALEGYDEAMEIYREVKDSE